jgi:predicted CXXCH cytochrome family protein
MWRTSPLWRGRNGFVLCAIALVLGAAALSSCSSVSRTVVVPLKIEGATYMGNKACAECHGKITRVFPASAHSRVLVEGNKLAGLNGCEACHGPGSKHIQAGGGRGKFIINPAKDTQACFQCHSDVEAEFHFPYHHPVLEGRMNCVQCHDPHGADIMKPSGGLAMARQNKTCAECHRDQARPFVFQHDAMREGCVSCHSPHGSPNAKQLIERDANLCLKCHSQIQGAGAGTDLYIGAVAHSAFLRQGTCWSAGCHTSVHGSNMSRQLLY